MYTGLLGKLNIAGKDIAYISNWSVEDTADVIEITKLGNGYKEKLMGQESWSASAEGAVDFTDSALSQIELFKAKHSGTPVVCKFYLQNQSVETGPEVTFLGTGYIESLSVDLSAEDKGNISISISGTGALTAPLAY